ncbi:MAG: GNAT family N-acetyltransferase [Eubacteriales bacterium]|nr:GNAT family N-acetyltransferase [Eubacteriales bacterium]
MISRIVAVDPKNPGAFTGLLPDIPMEPGPGAPLLMGYELVGTAAGILAADCLEDAVTLRWIAVTPPCRRRGVASRLLAKLCELAGKEGVVRMDAVACLSPGELRPLEKLLSGFGFARRDVSPSYSFPLKAVWKGPLAAAAAGKHPNAVPVHGLEGQPALREFNRRVSAAEALPYPVIEPGSLLQQSRVWVEDGKITGCLLLASCRDGIELRWLYGKGTAALLGMLSSALTAAAKSYSGETRIYMTALIPSAEALARKLAGEGITQEAPVLHFVRSLPEKESE